MDGIEALGFGLSGAVSIMGTSRMTGPRLCGGVSRFCLWKATYS
jgi:hypothetical protein